MNKTLAVGWIVSLFLISLMTDRRGEYAKIEIDYIPREEIMGLKGGG